MLTQKGKMLPSSIDVWSLGIVLLEIIISFPIYLAYKGRITRTANGQRQESRLQTGLLGDAGRQPAKIIKLQHKLLNLEQILKKQELCLGGLNTDEKFVCFLRRMLEVNP